MLKPIVLGLEAVSREGAALGRVTGILETGANAVLVVTGARARLIPFVQAVLVSLDVAGGLITVDWGTDF